MDFYFGSISITFTFHVVPNEFNIPSDGIIGRDFNKYFNCKIDYADMTIRNSQNNIVVPIISEPSSNKLSHGIFVPNTVVYTQNPVIRVLITTETLIDKKIAKAYK